ncbi:MAG: hypothetical protein R3348_03785 [Xanthomonadales bacterium]|nr:hypothetical protein [Xanthomonadales bacterium]
MIRKNSRIRLGSAAVLACLFLATTCTYADQEREPKRHAETLRHKSRAVTATVQVDPVAQLRAEIEQCGLPCRVRGSGDIAAPGGGTLDYDCNEDGDCSCFGAKDCVAMTDVCKEGTMGCNKQGCICEKDPDSGG